MHKNWQKTRLSLAGKVFISWIAILVAYQSIAWVVVQAQEIWFTHKIESEHTRIVSELSRNYNLIEETMDELESLRKARSVLICQADILQHNKLPWENDCLGFQ